MYSSIGFCTVIWNISFNCLSLRHNSFFVLCILCKIIGLNKKMFITYFCIFFITQIEDYSRYRKQVHVLNKSFGVLFYNHTTTSLWSSILQPHCNFTLESESYSICSLLLRICTPSPVFLFTKTIHKLQNRKRTLLGLWSKPETFIKSHW